MTSILKVDTIQDTAGNNIINESGDTITIGASGDTITIPSGATISNLGTASGFVGANEAKAWVNFNGTGTVAIREDFNVTSITDNNTGDYTINFTNALTDANYATVGITQQDSGGGARIIAGSGTPTTTTRQINTATVANVLQDHQFISVAIFR